MNESIAKLLKLKDVAAICQVNPGTVDNWCVAGKLEYIALPCGKRIDPEVFRAFMASRRQNHSAHQDAQ